MLSLLKKLFRNRTKSTSIEEDANNVLTKNYPIFPYLKRGDWIGFNSDCITQILLGTKNEPLLLYSFVFETEDNLIYYRKPHISKFEIEPTVQKANDNLNRIDYNFSKLGNNDGHSAIKLYHPYASELLFSNLQLEKISILLETSEFYASIPVSGCIIFSTNTHDPKSVHNFILEHKVEWEKNQRTDKKLLNAIFTIKDSKITNYRMLS